MSSGRLTGIASIALAVVVAAACGTSTTTSGAPPTTIPAKLALAAGGASASAKPSADSGIATLYPLRPTQYVLAGTLPDLGTSAAVRKMAGHPVTTADVQRFADALGLTGAPVANATGWELQTADAFLNVDRANGTVIISYAAGAPGAVGGSPGSTGSGSGSASVGSTSGAVAIPPDPGGPNVPATDATSIPSTGPTTAPTTLPTPTAPIDVPNASDAQGIAQALLDRMGVLTGQDWSIAVSDGGSVAVSCAVGVACPNVPDQVRSRTVTFSLVVDKTTVDGVDWSVTIGEHRRVESVGGEWATPQTIGTYALRSTANAFADLQHGTAQYAGPQPLGTSVANGVSNGVAINDGGASAATATGPAVAPTPDSSTSSAPSTPSTSSTPPPTAPPAVVVHITGVTLGLARWDASDDAHAVVDLVPTYRFRAVIDGGTPYDIVVLALDPATFTLVKPVPVPQPQPAQNPEPSPAQPSPAEPVPAPDTTGK